MKRIVVAFVALAFFASCGKEPVEVPSKSDAPHWSNQDGVAYVFDPSVIPEVHVEIVPSEWSRLLALYDADPNTDQYVYCNATYIKGTDTTFVKGAGFRLRGNSSRRRPQDADGRLHHVHFNINFHKFVKDDEHTVHGQKKIYFKYFKEDPCYVREVFCFDAFERYGVWTAEQNTYCRVWLKSGNDFDAYMGVYQMIEPIDDHYLKARKRQFSQLGGSEEGNLWKCLWGSSLKYVDADFSDGSDTHNHSYTLKTEYAPFQSAVLQLQDFIRKLTTLDDAGFAEWIAQVTDVQLLIRTIAVSVGVGSWDDYWCNHNNWYLYFDSTSVEDYHFFYIPYDFDYTLGTSGDTLFQKDAALKNPLKWGTAEYPLFYRLFKIPEYLEYYIKCLKELYDIEGSILNYNYSVPRIKEWQARIAPFVPNDTLEDCKIEDRPAQWGTTPQYRLMDTDPKVNFFRVKASVIDKL